MAGYSPKPLWAKLDLTKPLRAYVKHPPAFYSKVQQCCSAQVTWFKQLKHPLDFIHVFVRRSHELERIWPRLKAALRPTGMVWISWPKQTATTLTTNLNENKVRAIGLKHGLVDVKVCAIDDTWSGLKFMYRLSQRKNNKIK